jgi:NitT/TauT family transport system permease protein/taurine transport system permease protein
MNNLLKSTILSIISMIAFIAVWYLLTDITHVFARQILPSPVRVFRAFITKLWNPNPDGATLFQHTMASLQVTMYGYSLGFVLGIPLGIAMAWDKRVDLFVKPLFDILRPIPPIGWIPLMLVFFGIGITSKAAIIFISAFIPCVLNSYTGIKQTNHVHLWVGRTFGASRRQLLFTVAIPSALPFIFSGLRISLASSWASLVAAEMLAAQRGLGYMIQMNRMMARADNIIVGMLTIGIIGALVSALLGQIEKRFVKRVAKI